MSEGKRNGAPEADILQGVAAAAETSPDLSVPTEVVAHLVSLGLQTELGDAFWRGFCVGRGYPQEMRLGIDSAQAVAGVRPKAR